MRSSIPVQPFNCETCFFDQVGILLRRLDEKDRVTDTGDPSTSDLVLRSLLTLSELTKPQHSVISEVRLYRRAMKVLGTYVD